MAIKTPLVEIYPIEAEALCRELRIERSLTAKERDAIDDSDFAWPEEQKYPINTQAHLDAAAKLIGRAPADKQDAIKARAIKIAKRRGLTLPDTWQDEASEDRMDAATATHEPMTGKHSHSHPHMDGYGHEHEHEHVNDNDHDHTHHHRVTRAATHEPMTGTHTHAHPAFGSQGDDDTHEHEHTHSGDADHEHEHSEDRAAMPAGEARLYAPIVRIDAKKWEVEGVATSEEVDSFGTIFSYEASKQAFANWAARSANVREMHDKKAVGKGIWYRADDEARKIYVGTRVSRGARDTWLKVEDGVLDGFSVGATDVVWGTIERNGKTYPYLKSYKLAELSLVDNASNPDAQGLVICRADGLLSEVIDTSEETSPVSLASPPPVSVERAGARVSSGTRDAMHKSIGHTLHAAVSQMQNCDCPDCQGAMAMIDPDGDGDIDLGGYDDPDGDWQSLYANKNTGDMDRAISAALERILPGVIERVLAPISQRQQHFLARMAQTPDIPPLDTDALEARLMTTILERVATASSLSEVRASLSEQSKALEAVKETVERIEAQPAPGGPVLNGARPMDKHLANDPRAYATQGTDHASVEAVLSRLQASGALNSVEAQTAAASLLIQPMSGRRG